MAREDRWRDDRRFDWRDEERRMASRPDYGQSDPGYGYGDYRGDYRYDRGRGDYERRMDDARRREEEMRERRERAFAPFGSAGPTAYGVGPGFVDPASGYAPFAPTDFPYGAIYGGQGAAYGATGLRGSQQRRYPPDDPRGGASGPDGHVAGEHRSFLDKAAEEVSSWFGGDKRPDHRGRGPKGYRRSDERIREDVSDRLTEDPYLDASDIEVVVASGEVTLTGLVATREDKRRAERLAEQVSGVDDVQNNIKIRRAETGDGISGTELGARG